MASSIKKHEVVPHDAWVAARRELLVKEKALTRQQDEISRLRRELPWEAVETAYVFDGPNGPVTFAEMFGGNSQLAMYHFMFAPDWAEGCATCSFWADNFNGTDIHLQHRDTTFVAISRAPIAKLVAFKQRMGWTFPWLSSEKSSFNFDLEVSFTPTQLASGATMYNYKLQEIDYSDFTGISVFYKDAHGDIFHTYSCYGRGVETINGAYHLLDLLPKGRDEGENDEGWVRHHDRYGG